MSDYDSFITPNFAPIGIGLLSLVTMLVTSLVIRLRRGLQEQREAAGKAMQELQDERKLALVEEAPAVEPPVKEEVLPKGKGKGKGKGPKPQEKENDGSSPPSSVQAKGKGKGKAAAVVEPTKPRQAPSKEPGFCFRLPKPRGEKQGCFENNCRMPRQQNAKNGIH